MNYKGINQVCKVITFTFDLMGHVYDHKIHNGSNKWFVQHYFVIYRISYFPNIYIIVR